MTKPRTRPARIPLPALLAASILASACGLRTPLNDPEARDAGLDRPLEAKPVDAPFDLPNPPRDMGPELGPDLVPPIQPDAPPDRGPDLLRDLPPERFPDVVSPIDRRPDLPNPIDRGPDRLGDLPPDRIPDLVLPIDRLSDLPMPFDRPPRFGDLPPDFRGVDLIPPITPDVAPRLDGVCGDGATLACTCANGMAGQRICLPSHAWSECGCGTTELMRVRNGMLGTWTGTATTPWLAPYAVTFTFDSYTHYSARSLEGTTPALYYGTDDDSPNKRYDVTDIQDNGDAIGTIDIVFDPGSSTRQMLSGIQLSADGNTLRFWYMESGQYGPLQYELQRAPE